MQKLIELEQNELHEINGQLYRWEITKSYTEALSLAGRIKGCPRCIKEESMRVTRKI